MKIKERMKNCGFWVSLIGSIFLILGAFGVEVPNATAAGIINGVCSALVVLGIVSDPTAGKGYLDAASQVAPSDVSASEAIATAETQDETSVAE